MPTPDGVFTLEDLVTVLQGRVEVAIDMARAAKDAGRRAYWEAREETLNEVLADLERVEAWR